MVMPSPGESVPRVALRKYMNCTSALAGSGVPPIWTGYAVAAGPGGGVISISTSLLGSLTNTCRETFVSCAPSVAFTTFRSYDTVSLGLKLPSPEGTPVLTTVVVTFDKTAALTAS